MKYYLILGHRAQDKHKEFGKIQLFIDETLLEEFDADGEEFFKHEKVLPLGIRQRDHKTLLPEINFQVSIHDPDNTVHGKMRFDCPKKFKIIEIDEVDLGNINRIHIEVIGGPSNYTNGFMNKTNTIQIFPVFMFPESLLHDQDLVDKIFKRYWRYAWKREPKLDQTRYDANFPLGNFPHDLIDYRNDLEQIISGNIDDPAHNDICKKYSADIQWPGPNFVRLTRNGKTYHTVIGQHLGGDYGLDYYVHKKHGTYFLHTSPQISKPRIHLNVIWYSLLQKIKKSITQIT